MTDFREYTSPCIFEFRESGFNTEIRFTKGKKSAYIITTQNAGADLEETIKQPLDFLLAFHNVADSLGDIYEILHNKGLPTDELNKAVSKLYNILNHFENELRND